MRAIILGMMVVLGMILGACGGPVAAPTRTPVLAIPLQQGERVYLPGSGPTEAAPVVTLVITVFDVKSGKAVAADIWLDTNQIGRNESDLTVLLPGQFDGVLRVKAKGYQEFSTGIRYQVKRSRVIEAPVMLERDLGESV